MRLGCLLCSLSVLTATEVRAEKSVAKTATRFVINLDLHPRDRWKHVFADPLFKNVTTDLLYYFHKVVPAGKILTPMLIEVAKHIRKYFPEDEVEEMEGIAEQMGASVGVVTLINFIYQLEQLGYKCTNGNNTGPCPSNTAAEVGMNKNSLCSSILVEQPSGQMLHGRNMDWNIDEILLKYVIEADFQRNNKTLYRGSLISGMVGLLHAIGDTWSVSLNARQHGGNPLRTIMSPVFRGRAFRPSAAAS